MRDYVGLTRKVDNAGRLTIPSEIRDELGIGLGDTCEISIVKVSEKGKSKRVIEIKKKED